MNRRAIEEKLSHEAEVIFWIIYVLVIPISTGVLAYKWLPHESYNPKYDELIEGHGVDDGERTGTMADAWVDTSTGIVYTRAQFEPHQRDEAKRMALVWFGYGLIGCAFFAFRQTHLKQKRYTTAFAQAVLVDFVLSLVAYFRTVP